MKTPILIGIAGSSGSGKSTIGSKLKGSSDEYEHIRLDNYLKNPWTFPKINGFVNWEEPSNIKFYVLLRHLKILKAGRNVLMRTRPSISGGKSYIVEMKPKKFIVVEGFVLLTNRKVREILDIKFFFDLPPELISKRRRKRAKESYDESYDQMVTIPEYFRIGVKQIKFADNVIDASKPVSKVFSKVKNIIESYERGN